MAAFSAAGAALAAAACAKHGCDELRIAAAAAAGALGGFGLSRLVMKLADRESEVDRWLGQLCGEVNPSLRLAARAALKEKRLPAGSRAAKLLNKEVPQYDRDLQSLEDALALTQLLAKMKKYQEDPSQTELPKTWRSMSWQAKALAMSHCSKSGSLCTLMQVIGEAPSLEVPQLPAAVLQTLRSSLEARATADAELCRSILAQHPELTILSHHELPGGAVTALLSGLLSLRPDALARAASGLAACGHLAGFRLKHLAAVKDALLSTMAGQDTKLKRAWHAFFYALGAVVAPHLVAEDPVADVVAATATPLPTPGAGPHAAMAAANGAALMEMCLRITKSSGDEVPEHLFEKLRENQRILIDCVRSDANAYCGYLAASYSSNSGEEDPEKMRWLQRAVDVPISVAELALNTGTACLHYKKLIKLTLRADWIAGAKLLRSSLEISMKNVSGNLRSVGTNRFKGLSQRLAGLREFEPPWDDLLDV